MIFISYVCVLLLGLLAEQIIHENCLRDDSFVYIYAIITIYVITWLQLRFV